MPLHVRYLAFAIIERTLDVEGAGEGEGEGEVEVGLGAGRLAGGRMPARRAAARAGGAPTAEPHYA